MFSLFPATRLWHFDEDKISFFRYFQAENIISCVSEGAVAHRTVIFPVFEKQQFSTM